MPESDENRRKRILWRATHRGIREMDLVLGGFVRTRLATATDSDLAEVEKLLEIPDQDLLAWLTRAQPVPVHQTSPMLEEMLATCRNSTMFGDKK